MPALPSNTSVTRGGQTHSQSLDQFVRGSIAVCSADQRENPQQHHLLRTELGEALLNIVSHL